VTKTERAGAGARRAPRRRSAAGARDTLLAAAATVFLRKGYYGATVDDVAAEAGYSPAALYKHFAGRDELLGELWTRTAAKLEAVFGRTLSQGGTFRARLRWLVQELAHLLEAEPAAMAAFIFQRPYVGQRRTPFERRALGYYRRHLSRIEEIMSGGVREGALRAGCAGPATLSFVGLLYEFAYRWMTAKERPDLAVDVETLIDLFEHGVAVERPTTRGAKR
jgi:AcrR family transcriptional regulator